MTENISMRDLSAAVYFWVEVITCKIENCIKYAINKVIVSTAALFTFFQGPIKHNKEQIPTVHILSLRTVLNIPRTKENNPKINICKNAPS